MLKNIFGKQRKKVLYIRGFKDASNILLFS